LTLNNWSLTKREKKMVSIDPAIKKITKRLLPGKATNIHFKAQAKQITAATQTLATPDVSTLQAYFIAKPSQIAFGRKLKEGENNHLNYLGAIYQPDGQTTFRVYAPLAKEVNLQLADGETDLKYWEEATPPGCKTIPMKQVNQNIFEINLKEARPGDMYRYELVFKDESKGKALRKDPRSFSQPNDTLGWSAIYDQNAHVWTDKEWFKNPDSGKVRHTGKQNEYGCPSGVIMNEIHLGILGGYKEAKKEIDRIASEGICNTVLVMPTGEFYGKYNIGYDESDKFAPESSRGTPDEFKAFVDYAHKKGINVMLDVVPNHFGPHGTVVHDFGHAFDHDNNTPWGVCLNFEKDGKEFMRHYMVDMLMNWLVNYHVDGLRIDATEKLFSDTTLKLMSCEIRNHPETKDAIILPEHLDKTKKLTPPLKPGETDDPEKTAQQAEKDPEKVKNLGFDIQYIYDFKNTLFALLSGWQIYDCGPSLTDLEKEFKQGYRFYQDNPEFPDPPANTNLVYATAHDELNAFGGARLIPKLLTLRLGLTDEKALMDPDGLDKKPFRQTLELIKAYIAGDETELNKAGITKEQFEKAYSEAKALNRLSLGAVFVHPGQKLIFMGDERGEMAPFNYNADIPEDAICGGDDPRYKGRKLSDVLAEQKGYPLGEYADAQSKLDQKAFTDPELKSQTLNYTRALKKIITDNSALNTGDFKNQVTMSYQDKNILQVHRFSEDGNEIIALMNFSDNDYASCPLKNLPDGRWNEILNSNDKQYGGTGTMMNGSGTMHRSSPAVSIPKQSIVIFKKVS
jgi:1,4-alpha-glucan branching enzyme